MKLPFGIMLALMIFGLACKKSTIPPDPLIKSERIIDINIFSTGNWQNQTDSILFSIKLTGVKVNGDTYRLQDTLIHRTTLNHLPNETNGIRFTKTIPNNLQDDINVMILYSLPGIGISWKMTRWNKDEKFKKIDFDFK